MREIKEVKVKTPKEIYYLSISRKIVKQLKDKGVNCDQKPVEMLRGLYVFHNQSITKLINHIDLKIVGCKQCGSNRYKLWEKCKILLQDCTPELLPILFKEKRFDPKKYQKRLDYIEKKRKTLSTPESEGE